MTLIDALAASFIGVATVLLAVLWRRGPEKRRAFFVAGIFMAGATVLLAVVVDELEHVIAEHVPSAPHVVGLPANPAWGAGLSMTLPGTWTDGRMLILTCRALVTEGAPTDRWLSIARAIRPDEEVVHKD